MYYFPKKPKSISFIHSYFTNKMKTKSLALLLCVFYSCAFYLQAQSISEEVARKEAYRFFQENTSRVSHKNISSANTQLLLTEKRQLSNGEPAYYIFNRGNAEGFIVIAAQNKASVLGYADNGLFDTDQIPVGLQEMLDDYARELEWASNHPDAFAPASQSNSIERPAINPMCEALWNQNDPYNRMAPIKEGKPCVTGCVATAMAIIMYHHRWPEQGEGSSGEVDFSSARYEWDKMLPVYNEESSEESCQAVAQLMYHCGVAVNMKYGINESSAVVKSAAPALNNHFGYKGALFAYRNQYGASAWTDLIYNELAEGRPVLFQLRVGRFQQRLFPPLLHHSGRNRNRGRDWRLQFLTASHLWHRTTRHKPAYSPVHYRQFHTFGRYGRRSISLLWRRCGPCRRGVSHNRIGTRNRIDTKRRTTIPFHNRGVIPGQLLPNELSIRSRSSKPASTPRRRIPPLPGLLHSP